jgi:hypothetical protein
VKNTRLIMILMVAALIALMLAGHWHHVGMSDGGYW